MEGTPTQETTQDGQRSRENIRCKTCRRTLSDELDRQKRKGHFWKNCFFCRHGKTTRERQRRRLGSSRTLHERNRLAGLYYQTPLPNPSASTPASVEPEQRECVVCSDSFSDGQFARLEACSHSPQICEACFSKWLTEQVRNNSSDRIACPSDGCNVIASQDDVKKHATPEIYTRYTNLSFRKALGTIPDFRFCLRPGCDSGQIHFGGKESYIFTCNACDFQVCTTHEQELHYGETCAEFDERTQSQHRVEEEKASLEEIQRIKAKQCPGPNCGALIEKNKGCDHMTCRNCRHEFWWTTLKPYTLGQRNPVI